MCTSLTKVQSMLAFRFLLYRGVYQMIFRCMLLLDLAHEFSLLRVRVVAYPLDLSVSSYMGIIFSNSVF